MKQYLVRLKITWSNGETEYLMGPEHATIEKMDHTLSVYRNQSWIDSQGKIYATGHMRKIEFEEIIT